ncbi:MAG: ThiF family adenylyltransferase [Planctomycetia bacterium]|nr:ThiF family adenylyltransferase [Planctomycetia bacterium]
MPWTYDAAFARHRGLVSVAEQERLRRSRVAVAGLGGVGGIHLVTLVRLGIGQFHLADPDRFEVANFNRQQGTVLSSLGRRKATVMQRQAHDINPQADLRVFPEPISPANVGRFLEGVDVLVDGIDFFATETRRLLFREARRRGIWAATAGPLGFSAAWLVFDPQGLSFDDYFDLRDEQSPLDQLVAFAVGLAPRATHRTYLDLTAVDLRQGRGPSAGLACQLCAGVIAAEVMKILLKRGSVASAPHYQQFDAYRGVLCHGRLRGGNRHPWQRLKRWWLGRQVRRLGWDRIVAGDRQAPSPVKEVR